MKLLKIPLEQRKAALAYLAEVAKFLRHWDCDVQLLGAKQFEEAVGQYGPDSLGGIVFEGRVPFPNCDTLAACTLQGVFPKPPRGVYWEACTAWAIALYPIPDAL